MYTNANALLPAQSVLTQDSICWIWENRILQVLVKAIEFFAKYN